MKSAMLSRQNLKFENLESRSMLAGNVGVTLCNGYLAICGDAKGDQLVVHQLSSGDWCVTGLGGTKINGQKSATYCGVDCISIKTLGGNDIIGVAGGCLSGGLSIDTGAGNDVVAIAGLQADSVNVCTGAGNDALVVAGLKTCCDACFDTGDGNNIALLAGIKAKDMSFCSGKGTDFVGLAGVCVDQCLSVNTGAGIDLLGVISCSADSAKICGGAQAGNVLATGGNKFGSCSSDFKLTLKMDPIVKSLDATFKTVQKTVLTALSGYSSSPVFNI
ncbi:MAG TPA: hypothetical protein VFE46_06250 [Pirellulales bacterium]|jgi:hypothetical protein|nr:hypothetical protein [Pirellulales bacterium]